MKSAIRALHLVDGDPALERLCRLLDRWLSAPRRIPVRSPRGHYSFVDVASIARVDVDGSYLRLSVGRTTHRVRMTLGEFETRVAAGRLVRVHRSVLVNLDHVREVQPYLHGDYAIVMTDGSHVITGRTYRRTVRAMLEP